MRTISPVLRAAPMLEKSRLVLIRCLRCLRCVIIRVRCKTYLECEGRKTDDNSSREKEGLDNDTLIEESDEDPHGVGFHHGEGRQKDQVDRSFLPLDVKSDEKTNRQEECREEKCWSFLNKFLDTRGEEEHRSDESGDGELD